ncbi:hypothetical protein PO909_004981 [Leuciscus waleckii]
MAIVCERQYKDLKLLTLLLFNGKQCPLWFGLEDDQFNYDYDSTHTPEYDYNSTFGFFSNASSDVLEKFLMGGETDAGEETNFTQTDGSVYEQKPTAPTVNKNQCCKVKQWLCSALKEGICKQRKCGGGRGLSTVRQSTYLGMHI